VWDGQIWLSTATADGRELSALCVDLESGKILKDLKLFDIAKPQFCIERNSYASCTPVIEAGRIYVHFGSPGTACLDTKTGEKLWERTDLECNHHRGPASSPILFENLLILTFDGFDLQYVIALDKLTGKTVWKRDRNIDYGSDNGDVKKAYSTPLVIEAGGRQQLVSPSAGAHIAYNPRTGEELWRVKCGGMNASARPIYAFGQLYMTTAAGGFNLFAVRPDGQGDVTGTHVEWKANKGVPRQPSLLVVGDLLFMGSEGPQGTITCMEAKTGESVWQERLGGDFTPSPVYADGKLYFLNEKGFTAVVEPGRTYKLLAKNTLDDEFMASPAIVGKSILLRGKKYLYRIEK
jgi:outer membrane protein assembly factor BamB